MYEEHFGLSRPPFGETVDPASLVALPSRETVVRRLRYALENGQGPALLFGPPGSGKTLLANALARDLGATTAHLTFPVMPTEELLACLASELGLDLAAHCPVSVVLRRLRQRLSAAASRGERILLVVDEAHLIDDPSTFEALRSLLNFATLGPPDLSLLLVGGADVILKLPEGLTDRLAARCLLGPLSRSETAAYVEGRLAGAGAAARYFDDGDLAALHRAADGMPRRLNRLADLALLIAYAEGLPRPDARSVNLAIASREAEAEALVF